VPACREDLRKRIAAATPEDTVRGLSFNGIFAAVREHCGDETARATDSRGKGSRTAFVSYPVADFLTVAWNAADALEGAYGTVDSVFYEMGRRGALAVFDSLWGRTLLSLAGGHAHGLATQVGPGYRGAVSYGERNLEWVGPRHCRITFRHDFLVPQYHCGVLATALEFQGVRNIRVEGRQTGLLDAEYEAWWD